MSRDRWKQVVATFDAAVQREGADREAFLASACAGNPELRAEVESLLAQDEQVARSGFLPAPCPVGPLPQVVRGSATEPLGARATPQGYELLDELGRGGMGIVYKARQTTLNRLVALKMIRTAAGAGPQELARFRTEGRAVASLEHPHIVHVYDYGDQDGQPWFSMEYVDGGTLAEMVKGEPQPLRESAQLIRTLAHAAQHAHERGIVHRDLKPANVLLANGAASASRDGSAAGGANAAALANAFPKIADFGIAKQLDNESAHTGTGVVRGTPPYMAPEQAEGKAGTIGPATDVYALGVILYELLTGKPPLVGDTPLETLQQVVGVEPIPVSGLRPKVPRDLETVCMKCLRKEPGGRYASAQALAEDLGRFLAGEAILARPTGLVGRMWRWSRRNQLAATLAATLAVSIVAALFVVTWQWRRAEANARAAQASYEESERNFAAARRAIWDFGASSQNELPKRSGVQAHRIDSLEQVLKEHIRFLAQHDDDLDLHDQIGSVYHYLGIAYRDNGRLDDARAAYLEAALRWEHVLRDRPHDLVCRSHLAGNDIYLGILQDATGEDGVAVRSLRKAAAEFEDLARHDSKQRDWHRRNIALCDTILGDVYLGCGRLDEAGECYRMARVAQERFASEDRTGLPAPTNIDSKDRLADNDEGTGRMHHLAGRDDQALGFLRQARQRRQELVDTDPAHIGWRGNLARTDLHLGIVYHASGKRDQARSAFQRAYTALDTLVRENREMMNFRSPLAEVLLQTGNLQFDDGLLVEALHSFEQARQIGESLLDDNPTVTQSRVTLAESYAGMSRVHHAQGQQAEARDAMLEAQVLLQELANDHPDNPRFLSLLGSAPSELERRQTENQ